MLLVGNRTNADLKRTVFQYLLKYISPPSIELMKIFQLLLLDNHVYRSSARYYLKHRPFYYLKNMLQESLWPRAMDLKVGSA